MELKELLDLGFNKNEALVYLALIKFRKSDANNLTRITKFHKNIVYDNLEKLIDKGLVSFVTDGRKKIFHVAPASALIHLFEDKRKEIAEKIKHAEKVANQIEKLQLKDMSLREATVYRGIKGVRSFYETTLKGDTISSFGAPKQSVDIMGEIFWENYGLKRASNNVYARYIFNLSLHPWKRRASDQFTKIRFFEKDFEPLTETHIQNISVAIIVWAEEPFLFFIKDKSVADSYLKFFEKMWRNAKP